MTVSFWKVISSPRTSISSPIVQGWQYLPCKLVRVTMWKVLCREGGRKQAFIKLLGCARHYAKTMQMLSHLIFCKPLSTLYRWAIVHLPSITLYNLWMSFSLTWEIILHWKHIILVISVLVVDVNVPLPNFVLLLIIGPC